jgi:hypothetical protein
MPFYSKVENYTAKYAAGLGLGGSYGHIFTPPKIQELLKFDMTLVRDGVLGGSKGSIHLRWDHNDALYREEDIAESMRHVRFLQLKRTYKLNDDDFDATKRQQNESPTHLSPIPRQALEDGASVQSRIQPITKAKRAAAAKTKYKRRKQQQKRSLSLPQ